MGLVELCGSAFSGKTNLLCSLIEEFPEFNIVQFEKHYDKCSIYDSYKNFYIEIMSLMKDNCVISESVYSYQNNKWVTFNPKKAITILCHIDIDEHKKRLQNFKSKYGMDALNGRIGSSNINQMRNNAISGLNNYLTFHGKNYNEIVDGIKNVTWNRQNNSK